MAIIRRIFIIAACFVTISAQAQTTTTEGEAGTAAAFNENVFGVGVNVSFCSGMGLAFRHHLPKLPLAYQLSGGVIKSSDLLLYDVGLEVQFDLSLSDNRLYALLGGGYYYYGKDSNEASSPNRFGLGLGYEMPFSKSIGMSLNLMVTLFEPQGDILPLPSAGLMVYFK
jgi:hypothetical protein